MLAVLGALGRLSTNPFINGAASLYVSLVRGTPLIVQIYFIFFALPLMGIVFPPIAAGIFALAFNYGAYMTEIFRAGIQAVPKGQREAAMALGMPERLIMRRIVLPQATRIVVPAIGNDFVAMIKDSSLVSIVICRSSSGGRTRSDEAIQQPPGPASSPPLVYWMLTIIFSLLPGAPREAYGARRTADGQPASGRRGAQAIEKYFGDNHVLRGVDLEVRQHETVMLIGRSGSGKTTLLRCLNFLEEPTAGSVRSATLGRGRPPAGSKPAVPGADPPPAAPRRHGLPGIQPLPAHDRARNCIEAPIRVKAAASEAIETADQFLAKVQLLDKRDEYPARLSGGQKQRVAIARALCMEPKVLMFDEPTSALDPELIGEVLNVMEELAHEGTTMIVVTHEMHFAREAADRVVFMEGGAVVEQGPPEQVLTNPQEEATRQFLRRFLDT